MFDYLFLKKLIAASLVAVMMVFAFSGCGSDVSTDSSSATEDLSVDAEKETEDYIYASMSYVNTEYIETGDSSVDKMIRDVEGEIENTSGKETDGILATIKALRVFPVDIDNIGSMIDGTVEFKSVDVDGSLCTVTLSSENLDSLDMYHEMYLIYQVTDTILNTFTDIESVQFVIDGSDVQELNYMDISEPFTAESVNEFLES